MLPTLGKGGNGGAKTCNAALLSYARSQDATGRFSREVQFAKLRKINNEKHRNSI